MKEFIICNKKKCKMKKSQDCDMSHEWRMCKYDKAGFCKFGPDSCWFQHSNRQQNKAEVNTVNKIQIAEKNSGTVKSRKAKRNKRNSYRVKSKLTDLKKENEDLKNELKKLELAMKELKNIVQDMRGTNGNDEMGQGKSKLNTDLKMDKIKYKKNLAGKASGPRTCETPQESETFPRAVERSKTTEGLGIKEVKENKKDIQESRSTEFELLKDTSKTLRNSVPMENLRQKDKKFDRQFENNLKRLFHKL